MTIIGQKPCPIPLHAGDHMFQPRRGVAGICEICGTQVVECLSCKSLNRFAGSKCTYCGENLRITDEKRRLIARGALSRAFEETQKRKFRFKQILGLAPGWAPFHWCAGAAGIFTFSHSEPNGPVRLDLLDASTLFTPRGRLLNESLPPVTQWVSRPAINHHGIFVATAREIVALSAHGRGEPFARSIWTAPSDHILKGCGLDVDERGQFVVALQGQGDTLRIVAGNGQDDDWPTVALVSSPNLAAASGNILVGRTPLGTIWLVISGALLIIEPDGEQKRFDLPVAADVESLWWRRLARQQPEPVSLHGEGAPELALPGVEQSRLSVQLVRWGRTLQQRIITHLQPYDWVQSDPKTGGLVLGNKDGLSLYSGAQRRWTIECAAQASPALVLPEWICMMKPAGQAGDVAANIGTRVEFYRRDDNEGTPPSLLTTIPLPGSCSRALPPLLVDDVLVMAGEMSDQKDLHFFAVIATTAAASGAENGI